MGVIAYGHLWASDYDEDSCRTYAKNISPLNGSSVICKDIKKLNIDSLGSIDAFAYGFPCNDFSIVGEKKGFKGKFGPLYTYGIKILNLFRPKFFVAENVGGLASANDGKAFKQILNDLKNAGGHFYGDIKNICRCFIRTRHAEYKRRKS